MSADTKKEALAKLAGFKVKIGHPGIGHEITHGFDDQGRKSDGKGMLRDWWTAEDAANFEAQAGKLAAQYEATPFKQGADYKLIGKLSAGENIGDLGGVLVAHEAYKLSLNGKPAPVIGGFTGDQRFFLAYAQVWRSLYRDEALRQQLTTGPHSPGFIRAFAPLRNVDAWYEAFGVKEGDRLYIKPEDRVRICKGHGRQRGSSPFRCPRTGVRGHLTHSRSSDAISSSSVTSKSVVARSC